MSAAGTPTEVARIEVYHAHTVQSDAPRATATPTACQSVTLALWLDAHDQLLERDRELLRVGERMLDLLPRATQRMGMGAAGVPAGLEQARQELKLRELQRQVAEQTAWAQRAATEVVERDLIISELQRQLGEQTSWAQRLVDDVRRRDDLIGQLQATLAQQTADLQRLVAEIGASPPPTD